MKNERQVTYVAETMVKIEYNGYTAVNIDAGRFTV